ncbi:DNA topoisomerase I [Candidatus Bathyarchaeota archaeon]|nr:DNA topoisomerase I [Candidatus Bathyarchaeota archaeon]
MSKLFIPSHNYARSHLLGISASEVGGRVEALRGTVKGNVLVVAEKPSAAKRIAEALDVKKEPEQCSEGGVFYFVADRGCKIVVVSALGHLYTVTQRGGRKSRYPVFEFTWAPRHLAERGARRVKAHIEAISKLALEADMFIDACDFDVEGSLIGYNILKYACGKAEVAKRMKFSTLTGVDLKEAYEHLLPTLDFGLIEAGRTRHEVDWLYGINLSRALTGAVKHACDRYVSLSTGRVQGPTLQFLVQREDAITCFVPTPYWTVKAEVEIEGRVYEARYEKSVVKSRAEAAQIVEDCQGKQGDISKVEIMVFKQNPPVPFDLGTLQRETYRLFGFSPKRTTSLAEGLYLDALISYPRTGSQKLPPSINYRSILRSLAEQLAYEKLCLSLLKHKKLKPWEGKKMDPAHPAIYPTGNKPRRRLKGAEKKLHDLIVRRFLVVFAEPARRERTKIKISLGDHLFFLTGSKVIKEGWIRFYKPYLNFDEVPLPNVREGEEVIVKKVTFDDKFTTPPPRYNSSSLLKKMEEENIGTKATRGEIIQTLYNRRYITAKNIKVTALGLSLSEILKKYTSPIISVKLTQALEEKMQLIRDGEEKRETVLEEAISQLEPALEELRRHEVTVGKTLNRAVQQVMLEERVVGVCPTCKNQLVILRSRKTGKRFVGCTGYFKGLCETSFPLPQQGLIKPNRKSCTSCGSPTVTLVRKGRRSWRFCVNPSCPKKTKRRQTLEMRNM